MEEETLEQYEPKSVCDECTATVQYDHRYCANCGAYLGTQAVSVNIFNNTDLRYVFVFYFSYLFICLTVKYTSLFDSYDQLFWVEITLAFISLRFAWLNRVAIFPVLRFNNFRWRILAGVIALAALGSFIISFSMRELNVTFFETEISYFEGYRLYRFPIFVMFYSVALMPALFEELAFRGVMYNYCLNFLDERLVVAVTAFSFAVMHLSLISLAWLIPFGFFIGNLRRRYNTLWYGVAFHFVFNLTACIFDLYRTGELF